MNRFLIGGILAALVLMLTGGLNRILGDRSEESRLASQPNSTAQNAEGLGTLPLDQAGRLVQRQSEVATNGISATGNSTFTEQGNSRATISPANTGTAGTGGAVGSSGNVIPRTGAAATFPATGDIAPTNPILVQPGSPQPLPPQPVDSIPALW